MDFYLGVSLNLDFLGGGLLGAYVIIPSQLESLTN